ncbi:alpha/beta hydrolase family protein [Consotaella salsifontis]|uniref:Predicted dienelactone hydrolase n=1 Tax=Consotaella salsifontis TaxID=1365950 RepID=A0A1T4QY66_9HYPH|nr:prolyl oligopeptidase family serine peptidase [Consotaella salsifontis]SKA08700.1 Predicted dienelactone hydrolase [Consotaella salsifontis]
MLRLFVAVAALLFAASLVQASEVTGFRETDVLGPRPLHVSLWYPSEGPGEGNTVGENRAFFGVQAVRNAPPTEAGARPLALLSHGYGGSWRNLNWLAAALVAEGYVVAAPDHPGTTTFNKDPAQAAMLWERPHDLSRVIDALIADPSLAGPIDMSRIAAIGHSLGGWTVASLAGARFDGRRFEKDCVSHPNPRTCGLHDELGLGRPELQDDLSDPRLGAFVTLDLGLARGFSPESLAGIHVPSLIFAAGIDIGDLPAKLESGYLADHLPKALSTYVEVPDAMHFSFMQTCKPGAEALIEEETPGDGIVCRDGGTRSRDQIHHEVADRIIQFLAAALPAK